MSQTTSQTPGQQRKRSLLSASRPWVAFAFIGATAGMLIWSKLRLVSGLPRSAYAVPEERVDAEPDVARVATPTTDGARVPEASDGEPVSAE